MLYSILAFVSWLSVAPRARIACVPVGAQKMAVDSSSCVETQIEEVKSEAEERGVHLQTMHGTFLRVTSGESGPLLLTVEERDAPDTHFLLAHWRGRQVLKSTLLEGLVVGVRGGVAVLAALPGLVHDNSSGTVGGRWGSVGDAFTEEEVVEVVGGLMAARTVSLRCSRGDGNLLLFERGDHARVRVGSEAEGADGLDAILLLVDSHLRKHLDQLQSDGYTVVKVLDEEEAREARDSLDRIVTHGTRHRLLYSNGYQVRVPDLAVHDALFSDLLVHPSILFLVRAYLGNSARAATWSSNTLLPHMDHPVLGWHADYPYHDIEDGAWPDTPLGLQVLWMLDEFRKDNGGTMFFPGSHLNMNPPIFEEFSEPEGSDVISAPAGSVLVAHSAWWHRQTANTSPRARHALLACYTRGYVVPKADMQGQYLAISSSDSFWNSLDLRQQDDLRRVMLGPHGRGLRGVHV